MKGIALHVGRRTHREGLTVFPIWQEHAEGLPVSIANDHLVRVRELAEPPVPFLQVTVIVTSPVLVLDGDVLVGGLQDRVAIGSTLLTGGSTTVINVRWVEQERWSGERVHALGGRSATAFVRSGSDQDVMWQRVHEEKQSATRPPDVSGLAPLPGQSVTSGHRAREFIALVDQMKPSPIGFSESGQIVHAVNGPLMLRGIVDRDRLLHASVFSGPVVTA